jgi:Domain of Unknown Function (DUF1206)
MSVKSANRSIRASGRQAVSSPWLVWLARGGFVARGVSYVLIGVLAVQIGLGAGGKEADRRGALHAIAAQPGGAAVLWLLAVGFAGMALWRLAEAAYGQAGPGGRAAGKRVASLALGISYAFVCAGVVSFVSGSGGPASSNSQSRDLTARLMSQGVIGPDDKAYPDCSCPIARGWPLLTYGISRLKWISRHFRRRCRPARDCAGPCCWRGAAPSEHAVGGSHAYRTAATHRLASHRRHRRRPAPLLQQF